MLLCLPLFCYAKNTQIQSFSSSKHKLEKQVYADQKERLTIYCQAHFDAKKNIIPEPGFESKKFAKRAKRVEWEHVVPAENFGRNFKEWRNGAKSCVNSKGKHYKGRRCANKASEDYRYMQADMYNLYPSIGSVNASRSNYNFTMLGNIKSDFGSCPMKIENHKVEPPAASRGMIARSYLYMDSTYSSYKMSSQQRQLMNAWNNSYPITQWECERAKRIQKVQGNVNEVVQKACQIAGF
ncbi:endonuclease [Psychromonas algarum]|uniref:endonuclease n=1 Tax=Psychromonas algarum TaxID=2555643 RepID=UPI00403EA889